MEYRSMRKLFHDPSSDESAEYESRFNDPRTVKLGLEISGFPAFVYMAPEVYEAAIAASRIDKEILTLELRLPGKALESYSERLLVDEIVLTNEIESVNSTRREIGDTLERLRKNDRRGRFAGIVQKYMMLSSAKNVPLGSCADVRSLYDDLVLDEVIAEKPENAPDGKLFRAGEVHVFGNGSVPIHSGVEPESRIIDMLDVALDFLNDDKVPLLVRIGAFHFAFGYIHPFYDGNGRTNRFISSYMLSTEYEPMSALVLSYAVKESIDRYYKAYTVCEHPLNKGDITPFVITFSEIIVDAMTRLRDSLVEREKVFGDYLDIILPAVPEESRRVAEAFLTATLFSFDGVTVAELVDTFGKSRQTIYKRMEPMKEMGWVRASHVGRQTYYKLDLDVVDAECL